MKSIFIFRRDLRLEDNLGLLKALEETDEVLPIFIFTPEQVSKNKYKSSNAIQFMVECLSELDEELDKHNSSLNYFYGSSDIIIENLIKSYKPDKIYFNRDYTPYSNKRDKEIEKTANKHDIETIITEDAILLPVEFIKSDKDTPYTIFGFFNKRFIKNIKEVPRPRSLSKNLSKNFISNNAISKIKFINKPLSTKDFKKHVIYQENPDVLVKGGRSHGLQIIKPSNIKKFKDYAKTRNDPSIPTTLLSAYNKFGPISIREVFYSVYDNLSPQHMLLTQLIWRDFYYNLIHYHPHVFGNSFNPKYKNIDKHWEKDPNNTLLKKWETGQTGFPFVDAGMRQLNSVGWMHNRPRMVVANFLVKDLLLDWRKGEKYFARNLVDYDPAVNNGNWQWNAGTGADPERFGGPRIFNPWLQSEKSDPDAKYIKTWIPELKDIPAKHLHQWYKFHTQYTKAKGSNKVDYPEPMVIHEEQRDKAKKIYKK